MAAVIYALCALTAAMCATVLLLAFRRSGYRLLLWSGLCFAGLTINNVLLIFDKLIVASDLSPYRSVVALASMMILIYGLIWDKE
jgi:hypothetical protein